MATSGKSILAALSVAGSWESHEMVGGGPLDRQTVPDQVAQRIIALVKSGNLRAGDKLPPETELASAFQISRPSVREGLKMLRMLGVVESQQGGRYYVTDLSTSRLIKPIEFIVLLQDYDAEAHLEAREAIDLTLVRLACARATPSEIQKLRALATTGHKFTTDAVSFRLLDFEFHQTINNAARSPMLARIALSLYELGLEFRRIATETPGVIDVSVGDHDDIANGIAKRNPEQAVKAYRKHLEHVRRTTVLARAQADARRRDRSTEDNFAIPAGALSRTKPAKPRRPKKRQRATGA